MKININRRVFIKTSAVAAAALNVTSSFGYSSVNTELRPPASLFVIGPLEGYSPQIGTLVSMLNYNRQTVINTVKSLTMAETDYLHDALANTIGALILHLGATEKFYQINTFESRQEFNVGEKKLWNAAMVLGNEGRKAIKGQEVSYYLHRIKEVREKTLAELKNKDDKWLAAIDPAWSEKEPLNTYWKWFHVCEHESNHRGQIAWLKSRLPGAKPAKD